MGWEPWFIHTQHRLELHTCSNWVVFLQPSLQGDVQRSGKPGVGWDSSLRFYPLFMFCAEIPPTRLRSPLINTTAQSWSHRSCAVNIGVKECDKMEQNGKRKEGWDGQSLSSPWAEAGLSTDSCREPLAHEDSCADTMPSMSLMRCKLADKE